MTQAFQVTGSLGQCLCIQHAVAQLVLSLARRMAANESSDLTPSEIEERHKLLLGCGF